MQSELMCRVPRTPLSYCIVAVITFGICACIRIENLTGLIIKAVICASIPNLVYWVLYRKTNDYQLAITWVLGKIPEPLYRKLKR